MALNNTLKYPVGHVPERDFIDNGAPNGIKIGIIQRVDELNMKADVRVITGGGFRAEIDLTQAMCGPRSFWGGIPEVNSMVILAYRGTHKQLGEAVIIGFIPTGNRLGLQFNPFASYDPSEVTGDDAETAKAMFGGPQRMKRLRLSPGDVGGMSASGSEMVLSKGIRMTNRGGDLFELRDEERTLVSQAVHRFDNDSGVKRYSGPVRRQMFWLPREVFKVNAKGEKILLTEAQGYYGRDELQENGAGAIKGSDSKFANSDGKLLEIFNDDVNFQPVTYSNGKTVFYPSTTPGVGVEGPIDDGKGNAFTEVRTEIAHDTDLVQEVNVEIDGFTINPRRTYIEHVMGTVVGNDAYSTQGVKQYGQPLRPQLWTNGTAMNQGKFTMETVVRAVDGDTEVQMAAAAYLLRILGPASKDDDNPFVVAVQKQGKLLVNIPKPSKEFYGDLVKGVSADLNIQGAIKMFVGRSSPTSTSLYAKFDGGIKAEIGRNTDSGNAVDVVYNGPVKANFVGTGDANGNGATAQVTGNFSNTISGDYIHSTGGSTNITANGAVTHQADKIIQTATSGYTINSGGFQQTVTGQTFLTFALLKTENIASGGHIKTVTAGAVVETLVAGAKTTTVVAGAITETAGAAIAMTSGAAMTLTAGGAFTASAVGAGSISAGAALTLTSGAVMTQTAPAGIILTSTNIQLGGPPAVLGVVRGVPLLPPGTPTLDYITGLPLLGSAMVRSV